LKILKKHRKPHKMPWPKKRTDIHGQIRNCSD